MTLTLTPPAAQRLRRFLTSDPDNQRGIRITVQKNGCSGYKYSLAIAKAPQADDVQFEQDSLRLYTDGLSALLLEGTTIDYIEGFTHSGFKFDNPNLAHGCSGCGQQGQ
jgi:iron-sulfur cluster assembly protein